MSHNQQATLLEQKEIELRNIENALNANCIKSDLIEFVKNWIKNGIITIFVLSVTKFSVNDIKLASKQYSIILEDE